MTTQKHPAYLVYHPKRDTTRMGDVTIYHDSVRGNQDPYIWNGRILHTYCHITQFTSEHDQVVFWVGGCSLKKYGAIWSSLWRRSVTGPIETRLLPKTRSPPVIGITINGPTAASFAALSKVNVESGPRAELAASTRRVAD